MTEYEIIRPVDADIDYLARHMRAIDCREILAMSGRSPGAVLRSGVKLSDYCRVALADGVPFCAYGVRKVSALSDVGIIWLLGTDEIPKHTINFMRGCMVERDRLLEGLKTIQNWCDPENKLTIRWLKRLGFKVEDARPVGRKGEMFHRFYMEAK